MARNDPPTDGPDGSDGGGGGVTAIEPIEIQEEMEGWLKQQGIG